MGGGASLCRGDEVLEPNPDGQLKPRQGWIQRMRDKKRLIRAVEEGNLDRVTELLHRMPAEQLNYVPLDKGYMRCECTDPPKRRNCALLVAAITRNTGIVRLLLEFKAQPDTTNEEELSSLVVACENVDEEIAAALLEHDANPDIPSPSGSFPLHISAAKLSLRIIDGLLAHQANVNLRDSKYNTVLHILADPTALSKAKLKSAPITWTPIQGIRESSDGLIKAGRPGSEADPDPAVAPVDVPAHIQIVRSIIGTKKVDFSMRDKEEDTALLKCTKAENELMLVDLVDAGAATDLFDAGGKAALHVAIELRSAAGTAMALHITQANQTNVNLATKSGLTPLLLSVTTTNLAAVEALLRCKADPNITSVPAKQAALHTAISQAPAERQKLKPGAKPSISEQIALAILSCGRADVDMVDGQGQRPVFLSVSCCSTAVLSDLVGRNVQLSVHDKEGYTPMLLAVLLASQAKLTPAAADGSKGLTARATILVKADTDGRNAVGGAQQLTALHICLTEGCGNHELFGLLMELKADLDVVNKAGDSPLHAAICAEGRVEHAVASAVTMVQSGRANLDLRSRGSDTALTLAAARFLASVMQALVDSGADVNLRNDDGDTAMHLACRPRAVDSKYRWAAEPAEVLLGSSKLQLDIVNSNKQTALIVLAACTRWYEHAVPVAAAMVTRASCLFNNLDNAGLTAVHYSLGAGPGFGSRTGLGHGPAIAVLIIQCPACDVNVISQDAAAEAALHSCSQLGLPEVCTALLSRKAHPNLPNASGQRPLHLAIQGGSAGHQSVAEQLIDCGDCDVNIIMPSTGQTPLLMAVVQCKASLAARLVKNNADTNIPDKKGDTALHAALRTTGDAMVNEPTALVIILCEHTDVDKTAPDGDSPLHAAITARATKSVAALIQRKAKLDVRDASGCTPLHRAACAACVDRDQDAEERAVLLVKGGADCDLKDNESRTALHIVSGEDEGSFAVFEALMAANADVNIQNPSGCTVLHLSLYRLEELQNAEDMAVAVIQCGRADLNIQDEDRWTALMICTRANHLVLVKALLATKAADTDLQNDSDDTALTLAAARHLTPIMQALVAAGADPNLCNDDGDTAMHLSCRPRAVGSSHEWAMQPAEALLSSSKLQLDITNSQQQTALITLAACARWFEGSVPVAAAMVIRTTCSFNNRDHLGLTAIHYSLGAGPGFGSRTGLGHGPAIAVLIIQCPACDVNVISQDAAAEAALHRCSQLGLPEVCTALLSRKAHPNVPNASGKRPLHLAIQGASAGHQSVAEQLIDCSDCDINIIMPSTGQTPLLMTIILCNASLAARLVKHNADPNIPDKKGDTALHAALRTTGSSSTREVGARMSLSLIQFTRTDVDAKEPGGCAPVHLVVQLPDLPLTNAIIARGANLDSIDAGGSAALHHAIKLDAERPKAAFEACALALLDGGANPSQPDLSTGNTPLHLVTGTSGNVTLFEQLCCKNAKINVSNDRGFSPVHLAINSAAKEGREDNRFDSMACKMVETAGADANLATAAGESPLLLSAKRLRPRVLTALLRRSANPNLASKEGEVPLMVLLEAAGNSPVYTLACSMAGEVILCGRADVNTRRASDRATPAHLSVQLGSLPLMQALISQTADLSLQDARGSTAMHVAAEVACDGRSVGLPLMELLLESGAAAHLQNKQCMTPLHLAVVHHGGCLEAVRCLVDQSHVDINADAVNKDGSSALHLAIVLSGGGAKDQLEKYTNMSLAIIKSSKADLDQAMPDGSSPTLLAVKHSPVASVVAALVSGGADVAARNKQQESPLLLALTLAGGGRGVAREMALALAASPSLDVDAREPVSRGGDTALHMAVRQGFAALVELLLQRGADLDILNSAGVLPLHVALTAAIDSGDAGRVAIAASLVKAGSNVDTPDAKGQAALHLCIAHGPGSLPLFKLVMGRGPGLDTVGSAGLTPLQLAVVQAVGSGDKEAYVQMGQSLITAGCDVNAKAQGLDGVTALHLTVFHSSGQYGSPALFTALIGRPDIRPDVADDSGISALHTAIACCASSGVSQSAACDKAAAIVRSGRASLALADPAGRTAVARAVDWGLAALVDALLAAGAGTAAVDAAHGVVPLLVAAKLVSGALQYSSPPSSLTDHPAVLRCLIKHRAVDVNATDADGASAMHLLLAAAAPSFDLIHELLARGPDVSLRDADEDTALHVALASLYPRAPDLAAPVIESMIRTCAATAAAALSSPNASGNTPMHLAVTCNDKVYGACVSSCLDMDVLNNDGMAPAHLLILNKQDPARLEMMMQCKGRFNLDLPTGGDCHTPLHLAVQLQDQALGARFIKVLCEQRASVNQQSREGHTALTLALHLTHGEAVLHAILAVPGVDLEARQPDSGERAVVGALRNQQLTLAAAMLQRGAKTASTDNDGDAVVHAILKSRPRVDVADAAAWRTACLRLLIKSRPDLNQKDAEGARIMQLLLRPAVLVQERAELAMEMLDAGASACDELDPTRGMGWIHYLCMDPACIKKWKSRGGRLDVVADYTAMQSYMSRNNDWMKGLGQTKGQVANALFSRANSHVTAITLAALGGATAAVGTFLDLGVSPLQGGACGAKAVTPLLAALLQGELALAERLVHAGAGVDGESDGINPLSMAIQVAKGLLSQGLSSYAPSGVAEAVAQRLGHFVSHEAHELIDSALNQNTDVDLDDGGDGGLGDQLQDQLQDEIGNEIGNEVAGEVASEAGAMLFDFVLPGFSLLRWGVKLAMMAGSAASASSRTYSDRLTLQKRGVMVGMQWLVRGGSKVALMDPGMTEMVMMVAGDEGGAGWDWAGLGMSWPSSFEPEFSDGVRKIERQIEQYVQEQAQQGSHISEQQRSNAAAKMKTKLASNLKVAKTLKRLNRR